MIEISWWNHKKFHEFGHECMACLMILDTSVSHEESWRRFRCASAGFAVNDFFEGLEKPLPRILLTEHS